MNTEIISLSSEESIAKSLKLAVKFLKEGKIIAFPTDTLYGLGCDVFNNEAIRNLFDLKNRDYKKPINVLIGSKKQLTTVAKDLPTEIDRIIDEFWPGDLTLILSKKEEIPEILTGGLNTIGVRMPNNEITLKLICEVNTPLATTSANISGKPSITEALQIYDNFKNKIPLILDDGTSKIGTESTIVNLISVPPKVIRQGSLSFQRLKKTISDLEA